MSNVIEPGDFYCDSGDLDEHDYGPGIHGGLAAEYDADRRARPAELRHWTEGRLAGHLWWIGGRDDAVITADRTTATVAEWARAGWYLERVGRPPD